MVKAQTDDVCDSVYPFNAHVFVLGNQALNCRIWKQLPSASAVFAMESAMTTTSTQAAVMSVTDLSFAYDEKTPVLKSINASVKPGRIHVLLGPNATGKTTLLKLMLGILAPQKGAIRLGDHDNQHLDARQRARLMSFVPQQSASSFGFDVEHVVTMGRLSLGANAQMVEEAMVAADVMPIRHRPFNQLSAGQQQRVLLARALAQVGPQTLVMLLDEPVSAMDLSRSHQMMLQLKKRADRGLAIIVVLHDLNLAMQYADEVWLMQDGQFVVTGDWQDVMMPDVLGPVYRMAFERLQHDFSPRPILLSRPVVQ
jgi:iron complex transport system ATP-binding protein